jgi:hypothetical protein
VITESTADMIRRRRGMRLGPDDVNDTLRRPVPDVPARVVPVDLTDAQPDPADVEQATALLKQQSLEDAQPITPARRPLVPGAAQPPPAAPPPVDRDADELADAEEADRQARNRGLIGLATRQFVSGVTRTPLGEGPPPAPSRVPGARANIKSRQERAAEALRNQRQARIDAQDVTDKGLDRESKAAAILRAAQAKAEAEGNTERRFQQSQKASLANAEANQAIAKASLGQRDKTEKRQTDQDIENDVQKLGAALPGDVSDFSQKYERVKGAIAANPKDLPGVGPVDAMTPSWLQSTAGLEVQKDAGQMLAAYQKLITGAGASDAERANLAKISLDLGNERGFAAGLESLKRAYDAKVREVRARFRPEVVGLYDDRQKREATPQTSAIPKPSPGPGYVRSTVDGAPGWYNANTNDWEPD